MRLFEPAPGLVAVTGYNGRGNTTGTVIGRAFAEFLLKGEADSLPIPFSPMTGVSAPSLRTAFYESGFSLYAVCTSPRCARQLLTCSLSMR